MKASLGRAKEPFFLAGLFRVQLWVFSFSQKGWGLLFCGGILECMGFGISGMSGMGVFTTVERGRVGGVCGKEGAGPAEKRGGSAP